MDRDEPARRARVFGLTTLRRHTHCSGPSLASSSSPPPFMHDVAEP
jgi:hypothetical protein